VLINDLSITRIELELMSTENKRTPISFFSFFFNTNREHVLSLPQIPSVPVYCDQNLRFLD
jgi:hypothetical protein